MQSFMYTLLICSATMSVLAVLLILLSPFLSKRYGAKWQYFTWLIIIMGFIIPFRPDFNVRLVTLPVSWIQENLSEIIEQTLSTYSPEQNRFMEGNEKAPENLSVMSPSVDSRKSFPVYETAFFVWFMGVVAVLAYNLLRHYRLLSMMNRWKEEVKDTRTLGILQTQKEALGITQNISIQICSMIAGSMLSGLIKPVILLQTTNRSDEELSFLIRHELIHFKHKDLFFTILTLTAKAIHWFNPIVHLIGRGVSTQCEKTCDDAVLNHSDSAVREKYALFILDIAKTQSGMQTALTTNFYGGKRNMKSRLLSIMDRSKKKTGLLLICVALIFTAGTGFVATANTSEKNITDDVGAATDTPMLIADSALNENEDSEPIQQSDVTEPQKVVGPVKDDKRTVVFGFASSSMSVVELYVDHSKENNWDVSFTSLAGSVASTVNIKDGFPNSLSFSSLAEGVLTIQIEQDDHIMEIPLGEQTVSLNSFHDGEIRISINGAASNGYVNVRYDG